MFISDKSSDENKGIESEWEPVKSRPASWERLSERGNKQIDMRVAGTQTRALTRRAFNTKSTQRATVEVTGNYVAPKAGRRSVVLVPQLKRCGGGMRSRSEVVQKTNPAGKANSKEIANTQPNSIIYTFPMCVTSDGEHLRPKKLQALKTSHVAERYAERVLQ